MHSSFTELKPHCYLRIASVCLKDLENNFYPCVNQCTHKELIKMYYHDRNQTKDLLVRGLINIGFLANRNFIMPIEDEIRQLYPFCNTHDKRLIERVEFHCIDTISKKDFKESFRKIEHLYNGNSVQEKLKKWLVDTGYPNEDFDKYYRSALQGKRISLPLLVTSPVCNIDNLLRYTFAAISAGFKAEEIYLITTEKTSEKEETTSENQKIKEDSTIIKKLVEVPEGDFLNYKSYRILSPFSILDINKHNANVFHQICINQENMKPEKHIHKYSYRYRY